MYICTHTHTYCPLCMHNMFSSGSSVLDASLYGSVTMVSYILVIGKQWAHLHDRKTPVSGAITVFK